VALDQEYIDEKSFKSLYELAESAKSKVGGFIAYLQRVR